ncbi:NUDIX domain-containing protein [Cellulomonas sp. ATA003]|uniref:NUDIX hydrolase n=1 Tax=Cellulomonas sp. ATA003 TaxID=3073064 RepID=UPI002872E8FF|nr:NUDIX domain-containing protein [Cellulomonas sp. ATA003]WNB85868.1 NUDIX domain-containing protein [Cellulomonas sp. ATA003]
MPIPEFVSRLRAHVGTELLWLPGVSAVVVDDVGRVLLGRRSDNGRWAVISGILEPGEEPGVAAVREVLEETGVVARIEALASVGTDSDVVVYPNGDRAQYLDVTFLCRAVRGEAHVADDESTEVAWFHPDALPEPLVASSRMRIDRALALHADPGRGPWFARD